MHHVQKPKQNRKKKSLVCTNCRRRKIKCDKKKPCSNCIRLSLINSCTFNDGIDTIKDQNHKENDFEKKNFENITGLGNSKFSILDAKFKLSKNYIIFQKPSNTQIRPFIFSCYSDNHVLSYKSISPFKKLLNKELRLWKSTNFNKRQTQPIDLIYDYNETIDSVYLNTIIENNLSTNYHAILERLNYFQEQLNNILFQDCIPMSVVQLIFQYYFTLKPTGVVFNYPNKKYEYAMIALIVSIVELSNIFAKNDKFTFNFSLRETSSFNGLAIMLLNYSNFQRKRSLFSVYTLIILRLTLMIYGDAQSSGVNMQNCRPLFRSAVGICMDMGIHLNQNEVKYTDSTAEHDHVDNVSFVKEISIEQIKRLWNYLLLLDCIYFVNVSAPPHIDNRYCHGYYSEVNTANKLIENFVDVVNDVSENIIGNCSISLNDMSLSISKITKLLTKLPTVTSFDTVERHKNQWILYYIKFLSLKLLFTFQFRIKIMVDKDNLASLFLNDILQDEENQRVINSLRNECNLKLKLIYITALSTLLNISTNLPNSMFVFYNRDIYSIWIGNETLVFIDLIVTEGPASKRKTKCISFIDGKKVFTLPKSPNFDTKQLEEVLCNINKANHFQTLETFQQNCKPAILVSFLTHFYESILHVEVLFSDYKFFFMAKSFLFALYFMYSYINFYYDPGFEYMVNFDKIKNLTKNIISIFLQKGKLSYLLPPNQILTNIQQSEGSATANNMRQMELPLLLIDHLYGLPLNERKPN